MKSSIVLCDSDKRLSQYIFAGTIEPMVPVFYCPNNGLSGGVK